jgi:hypothetical protein
MKTRENFASLNFFGRAALAALLAGGLALAPCAPVSTSWAQDGGPPPGGGPPDDRMPQGPPPDSQDTANQNNLRRAPSIRTISDLVRIDVEVTDKAGKPVKGLPQSDFIVTEDDKPVNVSYFSYSDIEKIETAGKTDEVPVVIPLANNTPAQSEALEN